MYLINHFLDINLLDTGILISDPGDASTTNGVSSLVFVQSTAQTSTANFLSCRILANAAGCAPLSGGGFNPSFVLMDYVNLGNGVSAVDQMNGV